jgi:hypothetical protein
MREKLATVQKIVSLKPIPNADKIEVATVLGWECVVKKGEFKVDDFVVYIEVDSVLPSDNPYFEFMKDRKYRVKTIKLRGQVSQGLICPISIILNKINPKNVREGMDVTEDLHIKHYEQLTEELENSSNSKKASKFKKFLMRYAFYRKYFNSKTIKGGFPCFIHKTDEERIQAHPEWLAYKDNVYFSEKLDGCLSEDCKLETEDGIKTIKEICEKKYNGKIKSFNFFTNNIEFKKILNYSIKNNNNDWYEIELENGNKIKLTGNHKIFISNLNCWRKVSDLIGNEHVILSY